MRRIGVIITGRSGVSTFYPDTPGKKVNGPELARYLQRQVTGGPFKSLTVYARPTSSK